MIHPNPVQTEKMTDQTSTGLFGSRYSCPVRCSRFLNCCQRLFWDVIVHSSRCLISFCQSNHPQSLLHVGHWMVATPAFLTDAHVLGRTCQLWICWSLILPAHCTLAEGILCSTDPVFAGFLLIASSVRHAGKLWGRRKWQPRFFSAILLQKAKRLPHTALGRSVYSSSSQLHVSGLREESSSPLTSLRLSTAGLILSVLSKCHKINGLSLSPSILNRSASHWNSK